MNLVLLVCAFLLTGIGVESLSYDYHASIECLEQPLKPQYNGGIIQNPKLNDELKGWKSFGNATIEHRESLGNKYIVAHSRNHPHDSVSQKIYLHKGNHYSLSAWIQVTEGNVPVTAIVKTSKETIFAGAIYAETNCWSMLKGGFTAYTSEVAELYFKSNNTSVEIWIDNISLQPFTKKQWMSHQRQSIKKTRKKKVVIQAVNEEGHPISNASISIKLKRNSFPFGCALNNNILNNTSYQNWFTSRFTVTTFENEMKWYTTEYKQGTDNYLVADLMLQFAEKNNISVRGHNIFWDDPNYQPSWVPSLSPTQLNIAVEKRMNSIVARYKGKVIAWDVNNENLHFSFFENKLGQNFSARMFNEAHKIDGETSLFLNEYNTIEDSRDDLATPSKYIQKIKDILSYPGNNQLPIGIGLESHFPNFPPNLPYMRASIDTLASTGFPIWITEIDIDSQPNQAMYFEQVLREAHSHPKIQGMIMWTTWSPQDNCHRICLIDNNFKNLPAGDVVDKLLQEWGYEPLSTTTNENGFIEVSLYHGDYEMEISDPFKKNYSFTHHIEVTPKDKSKKISTQFVKLST